MSEKEGKRHVGKWNKVKGKIVRREGLEMEKKVKHKRAVGGGI